MSEKRIVFMIPLLKLIKDMVQIKCCLAGCLDWLHDTQIDNLEMAKEYGMEFDFEFEDHCDF